MTALAGQDAVNDGLGLIARLPLGGRADADPAAHCGRKSGGRHGRLGQNGSGRPATPPIRSAETPGEAGADETRPERDRPDAEPARSRRRGDDAGRSHGMETKRPGPPAKAGEDPAASAATKR